MNSAHLDLLSALDSTIGSALNARVDAGGGEFLLQLHRPTPEIIRNLRESGLVFAAGADDRALLAARARRLLALASADQGEA
jgi:hypothetical protein